MATMSHLNLSESADGDDINVTTASPIDGSDTLIHTAGAGTTDKDLVTLYAYNDDTTVRILHLKWGDSADSIKIPIPPQAGWVPICVKKPISDGNTIEASASAVNVISIGGDVIRIDA